MNPNMRNAQPDRSSPRISAPTLSAPKGGGAVRGIGESFESQDFTGTANVSISIPAPAARGVKPELTLSYSSGGGNGLFGMGFSLFLPSITRKTNTGIPRYDSSDIFILADEGELIPALTLDHDTHKWEIDKPFEAAENPDWDIVLYRPRHEGAFARIEHWTQRATGESYWRVVTKENTVHLFGRTENARVFDPQNPQRVFQWLIQETTDAHGNKIRYHYEADDDATPEAGHDYRANRYISKIEYGNYFIGADETFAFQVVFRYGQFNPDDPEAPPAKWTPRPDPFSSYRSGFEIRTLRRCESILIYHMFHDQFQGRPFLTRALMIDYERAVPKGQPGPDISFIKRISEIGFRKETDGSYLSKRLPPLTFKYSGFNPGGQAYQQLEVEGQRSIPGGLAQNPYMMVDLQGEGLPGLLLSDADTTFYWEPQGHGRFSMPQTPKRFPIDRDVENTQLSITALAGNGEPDLLVRAPAQSGFFRSAGVGDWHAFHAFAAAPVDLTNPLAEMVDMDGSGRADLLVFADDQIKSYPSLGLQGFGAADVVEKASDFPAVEYAGAEEVLTFADIFGDGLSHRVRIRNGLVECWPNLGYGHFGPKVVLENAPRFGNQLDARRLFLADVDGSGAVDLIYVSADHMQVYFNQSGNGFSDPLTMPLPAPYDDLSQVNFADVNGNGTSCFILTRLIPDVTHHYYDFAGDQKPYLLREIDNHMGARTRIHYTTSVKQYLEDKKAGHTWATRLFFPVQVVEKVEHLDQISGARYVTRHKYHDGYYDPVEREFRGFGFIETWDTEDYETFVAATENADFPVQRINQELHVPPVYTKTWYHTGAFTNVGVISRQYAHEYWKGDPQAWSLPDSSFTPDILPDGSSTPDIFDYGEETVRQAYVALAGQLLRQEIYGLDGAAVESNPYMVTETNVKVRLLQPRNDQRYAVFLAYTRESLDYDYERNPADPRITHVFTLSVDEFGNVRRRCSVAYPRRENEGVPVYPEQKALRTVVREEAFINHPETKEQPYRWIGGSYDRKTYEVEGLVVPSGCFAFDDLATHVKEALHHAIAYGQQFTSGKLQARLFSWNRSYYWNETQTEALPLGQISSRGLLHHEEYTVLTPELVEDAFNDKKGPFGDRVTAKRLSEDGGYHPAEGYWWNRGLIQYYFKEPARFFLPRQVDGAFAGVDTEHHLNPTTTVTYDPCHLLPIQVDQYLKGRPDDEASDTDEASDKVVTLTVTAKNDYHTLEPWRLTDPNENVNEVLFDPLGMVVVSTMYGTEGGQPTGDMPLTAYHLQSNMTFQDVVDPLNPLNNEKYLQQANTFFYYDLDAWSQRQQPASAIELQRQTDVHELKPGATSLIQKAITYSDGFGRIIESKLQTEPGPVVQRDADGNLVRDNSGELRYVEAPQRWIVSGRTVYNNKGNPAEQYLPYFSPIPEYENQQQITKQGLVPPPTVFHYDALSRLIRTDTPKGFFAKVEFSPWHLKHYDEDDTVLDSAYFKNFPTHPNTQEAKNEKAALDKATAFYNTPSVDILDNLGRTVRSLQNNLGAVTASDLKNIVQGKGITEQALWERLITDGYLEKDATHPSKAWVTEKLQPYDPDFYKAFHQEYQELAACTLDFLKENGLTTLHVFDIKGREILSIDPRLFYANVTGGTQHFNFKYLYDMADRVLVMKSADAGPNLSLDNIFQKHFWNWSARNFEQVIAYDRLERRKNIVVKGYKNGGTLATDNRVEIFTYKDAPEDATFNLRGRLYELRDQSGVIMNHRYSLRGDLQATTRQLTTQYKQVINWAESVPLEPASYPFAFSYNALQQVISETTPDGSVTTNTYDQAGLLAKVKVTFKDHTEHNIDHTEHNIIEKIRYNAHAQRQIVEYANGVTTTYGYEDTTLRLLSLQSVRPRKDASGKDRATVLQDIAYTYDPVGNITSTVDTSYKSVFHNNQKVKPLADYTYDALYRLKHASGRQHPGITATTYRNNKKDGDFKQSKYSPLPTDANALEQYQETYTYDDAGNILSTRHSASVSWTRRQEIMPGSNQLKTISAQNGISYTYHIQYDNSGNQKQLDINSPVPLTWNCCENMVSAGIIERPDQPSDRDYYTYDSTELRTRKVVERLANGGAVTQKETKIYLGNYEEKQVSRETQAGETTILKRHTLRMMDDQACVAMIHYWAQDDETREVDQAGTRSFRYQLDNNIGSVAMEVDHDAQLISYEEYFPYGGTAFIAGRNQKEVKLKDYRYSGKERDDSTGLYYYGARYYAPWLGRWLKPDPAGTVDGLNLYAFVGDNPIGHWDAEGRSKESADASAVKVLETKGRIKPVPSKVEFKKHHIEVKGLLGIYTIKIRDKSYNISGINKSQYKEIGDDDPLIGVVAEGRVTIQRDSLAKAEDAIKRKRDEQAGAEHEEQEALHALQLGAMKLEFMESAYKHSAVGDGASAMVGQMTKEELREFVRASLEDPKAPRKQQEPKGGEHGGVNIRTRIVKGYGETIVGTVNSKNKTTWVFHVGPGVGVEN
jgi:RHS repeat-associated protein